MILIDTNVISDLMRPDPAPAVLAWFGAHKASALYLSAVGEGELRRGAVILPPGRRRRQLLDAIDAMIAEDFAGRVVPFDSAAAAAFAEVFAARQKAGRPISFPDCQIAATARAHGAALATRNVTNFEGCGIPVIDPWQATEGA
ncbi:type II toxin-antitoxin system VapC family toxin [Pseudohaliea rubra]|uniref:Ribonuclease VapC n=1 Tax=Pseudohaliea rubra DSM 19751 TaxID=1265313 RepID=A0A095VVW4_9GAMM|nr:type II toxin-antitoxin system VapC family toxin [Pseudohaliea rubra]KGE05168.1 putative plasmid stability protein [Pseudohaliea rubra DSM 19751]